MSNGYLSGLIFFHSLFFTRCYQLDPLVPFADNEGGIEWHYLGFECGETFRSVLSIVCSHPQEHCSQILSWRRSRLREKIMKEKGDVEGRERESESERERGGEGDCHIIGRTSTTVVEMVCSRG